ncbi:4'-phosphopantetheinyl transferase superfamily protein [Rhizobium sp. RCC_161_2]|uniref:4'-phosphopantetheinyl transferase family protein n=1 Tax=Rhizobium sp. RCC_161_2 TaxID=3239219 RepID=UPI003523786B
MGNLACDWRPVAEFHGAVDGRLDIFLCEDVENGFSDILSIHERERLSRLNGQPAHLFQAGRTCLRKVLSWKIGLPPREIDIRETELGRPFVANLPAFDFNLSHSGSCVMIGISGAGSIGVDIQQRRTIHVDDIGYLVLTETERQKCLSTDAPEAEFFDYWTKKEAALKAYGAGFFIDPRQIEINSCPAADVWPQSEYVEFPPSENAARYYLHQPPAIVGYSTAVASQVRTSNLIFWRGQLRQFIEHHPERAHRRR